MTAAHVTDVPDKAEQVTQYNVPTSQTFKVTENTIHDMTEKRHKKGILFQIVIHANRKGLINLSLHPYATSTIINCELPFQPSRDQ